MTGKTIDNSLIHLNNTSASKSSKLIVGINSLHIQSGEHWAVIGGNGSGKSTLSRMLTGDIDLMEQQRATTCKNIVSISFEVEQQLLEREIREDDSEFIDKVDQGRTTLELISEHLDPAVNIGDLIEVMRLERFLHTGFRLLSTGERRRMMIARALSQTPDLLILDEPFDGLDAEFAQHLHQILPQIAAQTAIIMIVNRLSHLPSHITHIACLHEMEVVTHGDIETVKKCPLWLQLQSLHNNKKPLPMAPQDYQPFSPTMGAPIVDLKKLSVSYHQKPIIHELNWLIMPEQHWSISGPNGSGKSTLMNIICGDHPQCYSNDIHLFGKRRGAGESIWEVKHHMGLMSTSLHQQYRATVNAETVLLSGFFNSIGLYKAVSPQQRQIASEWLDLLQLSGKSNARFQQLSFGQQRMLLIARALIKRPYLLILDEPCQGLDPLNRALVIQLIEDIVARKMAQIIYVSHEIEDIPSCITHQLVFSERVSNPKSELPLFEIKQKALCMET